MRRLKKEEVQRKLLHIFSGIVIPGGIFYVPLWLKTEQHHLSVVIAPKWAPPIILSVVTVIFAIVEILRFRHERVSRLFQGAFGSMLRHEERWRITGASYICLSSLICSLIFVNHGFISAMVLSTFIWGDAVAAIVGQSVGRTYIGKKSLEGSVACFLFCLTCFVLLFPALPHLLDEWSGRMPLSIAFAASLCITLLELFPLRVGKLEINDNLAAPVLTGLVLAVLHRAGIQ